MAATAGAAEPTEPTASQARHFEQTFERRCHSAAKLIRSADVLVVCTGAEFAAKAQSAYAFAEAMAKSRGLAYADICTPKWIADKPELFYGFWGGVLLHAVWVWMLVWVCVRK